MQKVDIRCVKQVDETMSRTAPTMVRMRMLVLIAAVASAAIVSVTPISAFGKEELRVYISADMEGITGVVSSTQNSVGGREYEKYRSHMTADVNAAIDGALAAGASEIVVSDSHGNGENLKLEELNPKAKLVRSFPRALDMMHAIDESFDAAVFIGYHASSGTRDAVLAHTGNNTIAAFHVNGVNLPEGGINASIAGHFGVPVVMISGDRAAIHELRTIVGDDIAAAEVKVGNGILSATVQHPTVTRDLIKTAVQQGIGRRSEIDPYEIRRPAVVEVSFHRTQNAELAALFPGAVRTGANVVRFELPDAIAVAKLFNILMYLQAPEF